MLTKIFRIGRTPFLYTWQREQIIWSKDNGCAVDGRCCIAYSCRGRGVRASRWRGLRRSWYRTGSRRWSFSATTQNQTAKENTREDTHFACSCLSGYLTVCVCVTPCKGYAPSGILVGLGGDNGHHRLSVETSRSSNTSSSISWPRAFANPLDSPIILKPHFSKTLREPGLSLATRA